MTGTYAAAVQRILIGRVLATVGAAVGCGRHVPALAAVGHRRRNSYEIFSLVDRLGFSQSSVVGWGLRLWPVVPLLLVARGHVAMVPDGEWITGLVPRSSPSSTPDGVAAPSGRRRRHR